VGRWGCVESAGVDDGLSSGDAGVRELDRGALPSGARFLLGDAFFLLLAEGELERAGRDPFVVETVGKPCACLSALSLRSMNIIWAYCLIRNRE
jgi:hypothetical protein